MRSIEYTFWQDEEHFLGFLNDYPEYETQGASKDELVENLTDLLKDLESNEIPYLRKVESLVLA
jgi:predicted RNase H-like HicB family nuclease